MKRERKHTRKVKLIGGIKLETAPIRKKRSGNRSNRIGGVRCRPLNRWWIMVVMVNVGRRRRISSRLTKGKLEEVPDLDFGWLRLLITNRHVVLVDSTTQSFREHGKVNVGVYSVLWGQRLRDWELRTEKRISVGAWTYRNWKWRYSGSTRIWG